MQLIFDEADVLIQSSDRDHYGLERAVFDEEARIGDDGASVSDDDADVEGDDVDDDEVDERRPRQVQEADDEDKRTLLGMCEHAVYVTATPGAILVTSVDQCYGVATLPIHRYQRNLPYYGFTKLIDNSAFKVIHQKTSDSLRGRRGEAREGPLKREPGIVEVGISALSLHHTYSNIMDGFVRRWSIPWLPIPLEGVLVSSTAHCSASIIAKSRRAFARSMVITDTPS